MPTPASAVPPTSPNPPYIGAQTLGLEAYAYNTSPAKTRCHVVDSALDNSKAFAWIARPKRASNEFGGPAGSAGPENYPYGTPYTTP